MKIEHIIFAGDSAGGHLTFAVALLAILRGFKKPDGILSHYPVYSIGDRFYPSNLLAIDEWLLSLPFMGCVKSCFQRNGGNPDESPIMSPMCATDKLLNLLPQVILFACEIDPLRDQAILMLDRLLRADNYQTPDRAKLIFMKEYAHGFCSFDIKG
jgi:acetyl esterase/lipase